MKSALHTSATGLFLFAALSCAIPSAKALSVSLADLINGATLTNGGLEFFDFDRVTQNGTLNVPTNQITVETITVGSESGIRFSSPLWTLGPHMDYDLGFNFRVRTISGSFQITGNTLALDGEFAGSGEANIAEPVRDLIGRTLAREYVYMDQFGQSYADHQVFPGGPYAEIAISKDFQMFSGPDQGSSVTVNHFDQTFSQHVPEGGPGLAVTFSLFGILCWAGRGRIGKLVR